MKKMIRRTFIGCFLFSVFTFQNNVKAQSKLQFGLNQPFIQQEFYNMVNDTVSYANFFKDYNIQYLRFPGGTAARCYIYNSNALTNQAKTLINAYYAQKKAKQEGQDKLTENKEGNYNFPDNYYDKFLDFCVKNKVQPMIGLSTNYYAYNNKVYQVATFLNQDGKEKEGGKKNNAAASVNFNDNLKKYLADQMAYTHRKIQKVTWEIGNEEYFMYPGSVEGEIVNYYVNLIKSLYPQDIVVVSFANSATNKGARDKWDVDFVAKLVQYNLLQKINYFAPHMYNDVFSEDKTEQDIQKRISEVDISGFENKLASYFPANYTPRFFITEFSVYLGLPEQNQNINSNLHALVLFYYLMNFYGSTHVDGIIYHVFLGKSPFIYQSSDPAAFNNNIVNKTPPYKNIVTIPIQAQIEQIFYRNVGDKLVRSIKDGNLTILITQTNGKNVYFIINTSGTSATIEKNKIITALQADTELSFINYDFDDWNSKSNTFNSRIVKTKFKDFSSMQVNKYSVLIVK